MAHTHTVMPKKLAQALMDAGMQHFDVGGSIAALGGTGGDLLGMNQYSAEGPSQISQNLSPLALQQYGQQQDVYGQQQGLANQLMQQTQGQGPGQTLIAQQAGQNAQQQAALMNSARGANANPALVARQAAMAGAQGNQQALNSQAALQLQSQGALAQQQAQMGNQALQGQSILQGGIAAQNSANLNAQGINAGISANNARQTGSIFGNILQGGAMAGLGAMGLARGGEIPKMDTGGPVDDPFMNDPPALGITAGADPMGGVGKPTNLMGIGMGNYQNYGAPPPPSVSASGGGGGGGSGGGGGGNIISSLGSIIGGMFAQGGSIPYGQMLSGGRVPGQADIEGDNQKNDTVPTLLSPGEIVLPRSVAQAPDAEKKAAEFVAHLKKKKSAGYDDVVAARKGR